MSTDQEFKLNVILQKLTRTERLYISGSIGRDPLDDFYKKGLLFYLVVSTFLLMFPFDFVFLQPKNNVSWVETSNGVRFPQDGQIISTSSTGNLYSQMLTGSGFTLEVWAASQNRSQSGPARIISYSLNTSLRNFTLGQSQEKLIMRLRTTETDLNGVDPYLAVDNVFCSSDPQHIVITYDFSEQSVYVNGARIARERKPQGTFSNWDPTYQLIIGNEGTGDRPWFGEIFYTAIYKRPLGEEEIRQNYKAGYLRRSGSEEQTALVPEGIVARYLFSERKGRQIGDSSGMSSPINLHMPQRISTIRRPLLSVVYKPSTQQRDVIFNIVVFVPFGFLLCGTLKTTYGTSLKISTSALIVALVYVLGVESIQHFSMTRQSSLVDVTCNVIGAVFGITAYRLYEVRLRSLREKFVVNNC